MSPQGAAGAGKASRENFADAVNGVIQLFREVLAKNGWYWGTTLVLLHSGSTEPPNYTTDNFLQWFVKEQLEEVASMEQLLRVVQRAGEGNLLRVEEYLVREKGRGASMSAEE